MNNGGLSCWTFLKVSESVCTRDKRFFFEGRSKLHVKMNALHVDALLPTKIAHFVSFLWKFLFLAPEPSLKMQSWEYAPKSECRGKVYYTDWLCIISRIRVTFLCIVSICQEFSECVKCSIKELNCSRLVHCSIDLSNNVANLSGHFASHLLCLFMNWMHLYSLACHICVNMFEISGQKGICW